MSQPTEAESSAYDRLKRAAVALKRAEHGMKRAAAVSTAADEAVWAARSARTQAEYEHEAALVAWREALAP